MTQLDPDYVRGQFPAFSEPTLQGWAFFENAGGSYPAGAMVRRLHEFYLKTKVQPYAPYPASCRAGAWMDESDERLSPLGSGSSRKRCISAPRPARTPMSWPAPPAR